MIFVLDFGSQYTQLIAKKLRKLGYASEVLTGRTTAAQIRAMAAKGQSASGIILSGSPASIGSSVDPDAAIYDLGLPILGICFGYHFTAKHFGGEVEGQKHREYGAANVSLEPGAKEDALFKGFPQDSRVWMSHGDSVTKIPPQAQMRLTSNGKPAAFNMPSHRIWGLQFHPEVHHSPDGDILLRNFAADVCGLKPDWNLKIELEKLKERLNRDLGDVQEVAVGVSGGVDSTVLAVLLSQVVKVHALFVDHGFLREYDLKDLKAIFAHYPNIKLEVVDARSRFWKELTGVSDPEKKRKAIGRMFIEAFYDQIDPSKHKHLGQGTIYSDVIESAANELAPSQLIKSHHNVGGLPDDMPFTLVEPLRFFFKDEVREIGALLGIPAKSLARHPFPGPGLAIRCIGELHPDRIDLLRRCDEIFHEEMNLRGLYEKTWQAFCVLLPISSVGVMGDGRSYESVLALRAVSSSDAMTAEATEFPWADLKGVASRIVNEVKGVNRVVYDLTSKPPGTIEWE